MREWTIGVEQFPEKFGAYIEKARQKLKQQGILLVGEKFRRGSCFFCTCYLAKEQNERNAQVTEQVILALADAVAEFVTQVWERNELKKILTSDFYYYASDEVELLADSAVNMLAEIKDQDGRPLRFVHIAEQVAEQLRQGTELLVEGLLRFRIKVLHEDLHRMIELAIDEYLLELEYQEFVKMLRQFLAEQTPGVPLLHMVCIDEFSIQLYDQDGQLIDVSDAKEKNFIDREELEIHPEEIINVLIAIAPERLQIHLREDASLTPPVIDLVKKTFQEKAVLCTGCSFCHSIRSCEDFPVVFEQK